MMSREYAYERHLNAGLNELLGILLALVTKNIVMLERLQPLKILRSLQNLAEQAVSFLP